MKNYHKDFNNWSKSFLSNFLKSPLAAKMYMSEEKKDTPAMNFGRAYHLAVEGVNVPVYKFEDRPDKRYSMSAKANAAWVEELSSTHETIVSDEELKIITEMMFILKQNDIYKKISGYTPSQEKPYYSEINGYKLKCKPDAILEDRGLIIDWKTIDDVSDNSIYRAIRQYHYDMQAAMYIDILMSIKNIRFNFMFMFQEKKSPYDVVPVLVTFGSDTYDKGKEKYLTCCERAKKAFDTGIWEGAASKYENGILTLS